MKQGDKIRVFAPATVANVACGFDVLGFAIDKPGDELIMEITAEKGVEIVDIEGDEGMLPRDAKKNSATVAIQDYLDYIKAEAQAGRMGQQLFTVAVKKQGAFEFHVPTEGDLEIGRAHV